MVKLRWIASEVKGLGQQTCWLMARLHCSPDLIYNSAIETIDYFYQYWSPTVMPLSFSLSIRFQIRKLFHFYCLWFKFNFISPNFQEMWTRWLLLDKKRKSKFSVIFFKNSDRNQFTDFWPKITYKLLYYFLRFL